MRKPKSASAHRFIVISDSTNQATYIGTKEQLIALGVVRPEQFPEERKRLKRDYSMENSIEEGWQVKKLRGDRFELRQQHKYVTPKAAPIPLRKLSITYCPEKKTDEFMPYQYDLSGSEKLNEFPWEELFAAADGIIKVMERFNARCRKNSSYLRLVKPEQNFGQERTVAAQSAAVQ